MANQGSGRVLSKRAEVGRRLFDLQEFFNVMDKSSSSRQMAGMASAQSQNDTTRDQGALALTQPSSLRLFLDVLIAKLSPKTVTQCC